MNYYNNRFGDLETHVKKYVTDKLPDPFLEKGVTFRSLSDKLVLATAIFDAKTYAELSAAGKSLEFLTAGGIADFYIKNPLQNTYVQIELVGFRELSPEIQKLEFDLKLYYFVGPRIVAPDNMKTISGRPKHPPTAQYKK